MKKNKTTQKERKFRQEKIDQAIVMVNDVAKVKLGVSTIHGIGVFAMRDIKKGERIYADALPNWIDIPYSKFNKLNPEIVEMILERYPTMVVRDTHFMIPDTLMQLYLNHNDNPNYDNKTDKATRKVKKGEEITEDYTTIDGYKKVYKWLK